MFYKLLDIINFKCYHVNGLILQPKSKYKSTASLTAIMFTLEAGFLFGGYDSKILIARSNIPKQYEITIP